MTRADASRASSSYRIVTNCVATRVVVFGHSQVPLVEERGGLLLLNPGSATDRRGQPHCTVALLTITDGQPSARLVPLPRGREV